MDEITLPDKIILSLRGYRHWLCLHLNELLTAPGANKPVRPIPILPFLEFVVYSLYLPYGYKKNINKTGTVPTGQTLAAIATAITT